MSQLRDGNTRRDYVEAGLAAAGLAVIAIVMAIAITMMAPRTIEGKAVPEKGTAAFYMAELQSKVGAAQSSDAKNRVFWETVCDVSRELKAPETLRGRVDDAWFYDPSIGETYDEFVNRALLYLGDLNESGVVSDLTFMSVGAHMLGGMSVCEIAYTQ